MENIFDTISVTVSLIALILVLSVIIFNLYLIKRNGFYISVNCWFCNKWTKVLYRDRNGFECPSCLQYNGFKEDGSYNKVIEAQHTNVPVKKNTIKTENASNGLCSYCNNNLQLKIHQLANFTPLVEENFDIEIEHFRQQLENAYKLCKKCEKVLKRTIDQKNAWIFGNRLKELKKQSLAFIDLTKSTAGYPKEVKQSFCLTSIKYTLILLTILINCQILNVKIDYSPQDLEKFTPKEFQEYNHVFNDAMNLVQNRTKDINQILLNLKTYLPHNVSIRTSSTAFISFVGFVLQILILMFEQRSKMWKLNELLGWLVLVLTSVIEVSKLYSLFIEFLKIFSSVMLLYSYFTGKTVATTRQSYAKKKYEFKKLKRPVETEESFDEDDAIEENQLSTSSSSTRSRKSTFKEFVNQSYRASSPVDTYSMRSNTATLNRSFYTAKSTGTQSVFNRTVNNSDSDLNRSLEHLNINFGPSCTSHIYSIKRPVLTPPKLKNVTQIPWSAGGFWKSDVSSFPAATGITNLSRSSSQSSGFVSTNEPINIHYNSAPASHEHSFNGDAERLSIVSEPAYHFKPINSDQFKPVICPQQLYYKADNNTFYPVLTQNNLFIPSSGPQYQNITMNVAHEPLQSVPQNMDTNIIKNTCLSTNFSNGSVRSIPQYQNFDSNAKNRPVKDTFNLNTSFENRSVQSLPTTFGNSSIRSFSTSNGFTKPEIFGEKPVSGLFKNLETIKAHSPLASPQFRQPQLPL